jgi:hypothetical protein
MLAALALAVLQVKSLLPPPPTGWRTERLEFPLSFAPELDYRGHEDLLFAPGMFNPDSDSYFSYALAWQLSGADGAAVELDEAGLARFLETYFRGLCKAVSEDRGLERDVSEVKASVERDGPRYRARVAMFDPFTTGAALDLALELFVHEGPRATEVLGLASPLDVEAPIWTELHALGASWRAARPAPVVLNHLFAVVEPATYAALSGSAFLRETFAVSEERTTVRADRTYTGFYLYGAHTYFEFLQPGAMTGTGVALGVEQPDALAGFARRLEAEKVPAQGGPITRKLGDEELPWFQILGFEMPSAGLTGFAMEYDPRFLARWHADVAPAAGGIARRDVLERYAAALERSALRAKQALVDVTEVELLVTDAARERWLAIARAAGWETEASGEGRTCYAPGFRLVLRPTKDEASIGITRFDLALREPLEHAPLQLGDVALTFHGRTASLALRASAGTAERNDAR